ncbi:hypothetical protein GQ43DRAFT_413668 [Delitschia confertaspora ATCC 74209]|uniref:Uncharacterized protein n=1 Tax=Delitschia confertaspora ATCC 74209 TaxID=1513339 RepID=A0A9P4MR17_9PLEO|nr:hypothetical protein GQ43DRAFT_413668 [Delitschia confertaspora ATCC 74209]
MAEESTSHLLNHSGAIFARRPSFFRSRRTTSHHHKTPPLPPSSQPSQPSQPSQNPLPPPPGPNSSTRKPSDSSTVPLSFDGQSHPPSKLPNTPPRPKHRHASRHSISSSVADIGATLRRSRSASFRTNDSTNTNTSSSSHKKTPSATLALSFSPEKPSQSNVPSTTAATTSSSSSSSSRPTLSISTFGRNKKAPENLKPGEGGGGGILGKSPLSAVDNPNPKTPFGMAVPVPLRYPPSQKEIRRAQTDQNFNNAGLAAAAPIQVGGGAGNPHMIFQHIHEMASKRISTLDYLRKAHEGRIYWFNTLLFSKSDLQRLPSFTARNLARRATNYLLLGFSLPTVLDLNSNSPLDYLRALNALLLEFETYQSLHPPDGSHPSSLSRGRIPQMFRKTLPGGKARRSSSATNDIPTLATQFSDPVSAIEPPLSDPSDLLNPGEEYTLLMTPSLPFDPDFFSTFATLCDVLIDCYTKVMSLLSTPEAVVLAGNGVPGVVGDLFAKADARIRKIILGGVVKEFEEASRAGVRGEVAGVGKVVLGGLM